MRLTESGQELYFQLTRSALHLIANIVPLSAEQTISQVLAGLLSDYATAINLQCPSKYQCLFTYESVSLLGIPRDLCIWHNL